MARNYLVLGGGIAGFSAAEEIRAADPDGVITLITAEKELPYLRPLLSKTEISSFQRGTIALEGLEWYEERRIRLCRNRTVTEICPEEKRVNFSSGVCLPYDAMVYALGAEALVPPIHGCDREGVLTVRTVADFHRLRSALAVAEKAVVIGGGVIGLEMAWEMARMDVEVTVLEAADRLLARVLDPQSSELLKRQIESEGIRCITGVLPQEILRKNPAQDRTVPIMDSRENRINCVRLADGRELEADLVLISCGIVPVTEPARKAGLRCGDTVASSPERTPKEAERNVRPSGRQGICVNEYLETYWDIRCKDDRTERFSEKKATGIFAAGDCLQGAPGLWRHAAESGRIAGANAVAFLKGEPLQRLEAEPEPVILNTGGFCLFSMGDVTEDETVEIVLKEGGADERTQYFEVNRRDSKAPYGEPPQSYVKQSYEKRFYRQGRLCGAVLIGDLSHMEEIRQELLQNKR